MAELRLSTAEQRALFAALRGKGDVHIDDLFKALGGPPQYDTSTRRRQVYLGSYLTRLRRKLEPHGLTVAPGERRRTYRLNVV